MTAPFDPYHKWLGIPPAHQPPTHYRLLGVEPFEADPEVIEAAVNQRVAYLQDLAVGERVKESQKLLNEVAAARRVLLNVEKKAAYDAGLRAAQAPPAPPPAAAPQVFIPSSSSQEMPIFRPTGSAPQIPAYQPPAESDPAFSAMTFGTPAPSPRASKRPPASAKAPRPAPAATPGPTDGPAPLKPWVLVAGGFGCLLFGFVATSAVLLLGGKPAAKPPANKRAEQSFRSPAVAAAGLRPSSPSSPPGWHPCPTGPT